MRALERRGRAIARQPPSRWRSAALNVSQSVLSCRFLSDEPAIQRLRCDALVPQRGPVSGRRDALQDGVSLGVQTVGAKRLAAAVERPDGEGRENALHDVRVEALVAMSWLR